MVKMMTPFYDDNLQLWHVRSTAPGYPTVASFITCDEADAFRCDWNYQ